MATSTQVRRRGIINNYLLPEFSELCLRDLKNLQLQRYFSAMATSSLTHESRHKIRDVLSSILASAVRYQLLVKDPSEVYYFRPAALAGGSPSPTSVLSSSIRYLAGIPERYSTMVYVAVYSGLRVQ